LVDHLLYTAATSSFGTSSALLPHVTPLSQSFPITFSNAVVSKLTLMQKNLARGLASGPLLPTSKTWPGPGELALLRLLGVVFSTSDFSHVVAAPALLLISQYLGQCRLRTMSDLASGLFLCTLALQYESRSKRVVPEVVNFLAQAAALLFPRQPAVPLERGSYPMPDLDREDVGTLLRLQEADDDTRLDELDLLQLLQGTLDAGAARVGLAKIALTLTSEFSGLYNTMPAFIELFDPILRSLLSIELVKLPPSVQVSHDVEAVCPILRAERSHLRVYSASSRQYRTVSGVCSSFLAKLDVH
jgi:nucleolar protein 14